MTKYLVIREDRIIVITDKYIDAIRAYKRRFAPWWRTSSIARYLSRYGAVSLYLRMSPRAKVTPPGIYTLRTIATINASNHVKKKLRKLLLRTKVERKPPTPSEKKPHAALMMRIERYRVYQSIIDIVIDYKSRYNIRADLIGHHYISYSRNYRAVTIYESRNRHIAIVETSEGYVYISVPKGDFTEIRRYSVTKTQIKEILDLLGKIIEDEYKQTPLAKSLERFFEQLKTEVALDVWESI